MQNLKLNRHDEQRTAFPIRGYSGINQIICYRTQENLDTPETLPLCFAGIEAVQGS